MQRFAGKVAMVTGAASGIGRATALRLAGEGADLFITDINADALEETAATIREAGQKVICHVFDVADPEQCSAAVSKAVGDLGKLDVLCNIAGIHFARHLADISPQDWRRMSSINLDSVFYLCQAAMPHLIESKGNIVNMASTAGLEGQIYNTAYCATKGGVVMMSKALAVEFATSGVRVNSVCPGGVKTALTDAFAMPENPDMNLFSRMFSLNGEMCEPEQIADAVAFLAAEDSSFITGIALPVDGGQTTG